VNTACFLVRTLRQKSSMKVCKRLLRRDTRKSRLVSSMMSKSTSLKRQKLKRKIFQITRSWPRNMTLKKLEKPELLILITISSQMAMYL
jgi:hypothetical protein